MIQCYGSRKSRHGYSQQEKIIQLSSSHKLCYFLFIWFKNKGLKMHLSNLTQAMKAANLLRFIQNYLLEVIELNMKTSYEDSLPKNLTPTPMPAFTASITLALLQPFIYLYKV